MRTPDFEGNLKKVLKKQKPDRATLFEFLISEEAEVALSGYQLKEDTPEEHIKRKILAFYHAGYDFVPFLPGNLWFTKNPHKTAQTYSLNDGGVITDRESFEKYPWPAMETIHYRTLEIAQKFLPDGMKIMAYCPDGILENVIGLCGYENLCYLLADDRELVKDIFTEVGTRIEKYLTDSLAFECVGMTFCNDDWGFKNSTMISHDDLREFVYPYYKNIAKATHAADKVIGMHSCGNFRGIYEELYDVIGFDGKHSNEDTILSVEDAYERYSDHIAILGGIDMNFLCRASQEDIRKRCLLMLERSEKKGAYALGSGNSIARYVPLQSYFTMLRTVNPDLSL